MAGINDNHSKISCPACKQEIVYYDAENSMYYACSYCLAFFEHEHDKEPVIITGFSNGELVTPHISIGTTGSLDGVTWQVVGFMVKKEAGDSVYWREYILFRKGNPYKILAEYNGHWMLIKPAPSETYKPIRRQAKDYYIRHAGSSFNLYHSYQFEVVYARGEFDWNIIDDSNNMIVYEYVAPPNILIQEQMGEEVTWYKGKYKEPEEIALTFDVIKSDLPRRKGQGAIQPVKFFENYPHVMRVAIAVSVLIIVTQILLYLIKPEKELLNMSFNLERNTPGESYSPIKPIVTSSFNIHGPAALTAHLSADVDNDWVEYAVTLVNDKTGSTYDMSKVVEYYYGYEGGESWTEGSRNTEGIFNNIPSGQYHINIYPSSDAAKTSWGGIQVKENEPLYSNLILTFLAVLAYPIILLIKKHNAENSRWQ